MLVQKWLPFVLGGVLVLLVLEKIDLTTADLGRHLANGRAFVTSGKIVTTNFYSYTYPDFPTVNHHWGAGVIFFLLYQLGNFDLLSWTYALGLAAALILFWKVAEKAGGALPTLLAFIFLLPLITHRREVRPELFTYLFTGIFVYLLAGSRRLYLLPFLEVVWVNTHVYFFLGPVIVAIFCLFQRRLWRYFILVSLATLVNPFGLWGAIYPLTIWRDFAYRLVENQSVFFLEGLNFTLPNFLVFKLVILAFVVMLVLLFWRQRWLVWHPLVLLGAVGVGLGLLAIRNFTLMGLFLLPAGSFLGKRIAASAFVVGVATLVVVASTLVSEGQRIDNSKVKFGTGLLPGNLEAARFFKNNHLAGPVFNNYDVGGYLIFSLSPEELVFVDNRPEAYPGEFFRDTYIPMQESEQKWREVDQKYHFRTIFFSHRDYTPWGQHFLAARLADPAWKVVYLDNFVIILVALSS